MSRYTVADECGPIRTSDGLLCAALVLAIVFFVAVLA